MTGGGNTEKKTEGRKKIGRGGQTRQEEMQKPEKKEEDGKVRIGRSEGQGILFFFFVKVHMSGWRTARGIQPKNLFNVCFTG